MAVTNTAAYIIEAVGREVCGHQTTLAGLFMDMSHRVPISHSTMVATTEPHMPVKEKERQILPFALSSRRWLTLHGLLSEQAVLQEVHVAGEGGRGREKGRSSMFVWRDSKPLTSFSYLTGTLIFSRHRHL